MKTSTMLLVGGVALAGFMMAQKKRPQMAQDASISTGPTQGPNPLYYAGLLTNAQEAMAELIRAEAEASGLDPAFMIALAVTESSLDPSAVGDDGISVGLFQLNKKFHKLSHTQLLDPLTNADTSMVEMLALIRRFPGNTFGAYAEAWTLGGSGRFVQGKTNPSKIRQMQKAIADLHLDLDLLGVPNA